MMGTLKFVCALLFFSLVAALPPGAVVKVESTLPEVQACAAFAVGSYNTFSKDPYLYVIAKFNSVTMANIGGGEYDMEVELGKTNCLKESHTDSSSCKISPEAKVVHCHFVVLSAPWKHERFLISSSCT